MLINIILCVLAFAAYYLNLFIYRTDKVKEPTWSFWLNDNFPELIYGALMTTISMIVIHLPQAEAILKLSNIASWIPKIFDDLTLPALSIACGFGAAKGAYLLVKVKVTQMKKKFEKKDIG